MMVAWRRAAPAVVASALTVAATLACLLLARSTIITDFGIVGIVGVLSAAVVVLGAYPALLLVMGRGVFWPVVPRHAPEFVHRGPWAWLARIVSRDGGRCGSRASCSSAAPPSGCSASTPTCRP